MDVAGWHLYLRDMNAAPGIKMAAALAQHFGPLVRGMGVEAVWERWVVRTGEDGWCG